MDSRSESRYRPLQELGRGSQGEVFLARDTLKDQTVVIKKVPFESTSADLAQKEFHLLSKLSHPHLPKLLDFGWEKEGTEIFWTTPYLPGTSLDRLKGLSVKEGIDALVQTLRCLEYLHAQGILHLDIKPSNLFLTEDHKLKILDLGLSRLIGSGSVTRVGGTYAYASPEQLLGKPLDGRSDLYSLGISFYEIFSGRHPFEVKDLTDMVFHHLQTNLPFLSERVRGVDARFDAVMARLMAKDREERFQRASEVIEAINEFADSPYPVEEATGWEGYKKTGWIREFEGEIAEALPWLSATGRTGSGPVGLLRLANFPPEAAPVFLEQLHHALRFNGKEAFLVRRDDNWMSLYLKSIGVDPPGDRSKLEDFFLSHLRENLPQGSPVFLFEGDPFPHESFAGAVRKIERFDADNHPLFLVGPFHLPDRDEIPSVRFIEEEKGVYLPKPLKDLKGDHRSLLRWFALHEEGMSFDELRRLSGLPVEHVLKSLRELNQHGTLGYRKQHLVLLNPSLREALDAEIPEWEKREMIGAWLAENPSPVVRGLLLLKTGRAAEAKPLLLSEVKRAVELFQLEKGERLAEFLEPFRDDPEVLRLSIEIHFTTGSYRMALTLIDKLESLSIPQDVRLENSRRHGWVSNRLGDVNGALTSYQKALEVALSIGNREEAASLANEIAYLIFKTGDIDRSLSVYEEYANDFHRVKNPMIASNIRHDVALAAAGKIDEAWAVFRQKTDLLKNEADPRVHINLSLTEAYLYQIQKDWEKAFRLYEKILESCRKNRIYSPQEGIMENLKNIKLELGKDVTQPALRTEQPPSNWIPGKSERLFEVLEDISSEEQLQNLLEKVVDYAIDLTGALRGFLLLRKEDVAGVPEFTIRVARNFEERPQGEVPVSFTFFRKVFQTGRAMVTVDASSDPDLKAMTSVMKFDLRSIVCAPLKIKNKNIGVFYLDHPLEKGLFSEAQLKDLEVLAHQSALAIDKVQLIGRLKQSEEELRNELKKSSDLLVLSEQELEKLRIRLQQSQRQQKTRFPYEGIVAQSPQMTKILQTLDKLTNTHVPIFVHGESGTGKELVARALHFNSDRKKGSFVSVNCGAVPENLMESEFFGAQKGAYTGAVKDTAGLFEQANGGTLFLDEIGEMPLHLQVKLLRVLQEKKVRRLGGQAETPIDVRIITASNRDLQQLVKKKLFREDLFYRLAAVKVTLPPLRDRRADIPLLVGHFLGKFAQEHGLKRTPAVTRGAMKKLLGYSWPGNVRELEHVITNACLMKEGAKIEEGDLQFLDTSVHGIAEETPDAGTMRLVFDEKKRWEDYETEIIGQLVLLFGGNKSRAAKQLGLSRTTLNKKIPSS